MFVYSFKASHFKIVLSIMLCAVVAVSAFILMPDSDSAVTVNGMQYDKKITFDGIEKNEDILKFGENLGFSLEATPISEKELKLPSKFDAVTEKYNELQKSQGFNLAKYKNKDIVTRTYKINALPNDESLPAEDVLFTVITCKDKIIGGDVYFTGENPKVKGILD